MHFFERTNTFNKRISQFISRRITLFTNLQRASLSQLNPNLVRETHQAQVLLA